MDYDFMKTKVESCLYLKKYIEEQPINDRSVHVRDNYNYFLCCVVKDCQYFEHTYPKSRMKQNRVSKLW